MDVAINIEQFMILPFVGGGVLYSTRKILDAIGKYGNRFSEILRCLQQIESRCDTIVSNALGDTYCQKHSTANPTKGLSRGCISI